MIPTTDTNGPGRCRTHVDSRSISRQAMDGAGHFGHALHAEGQRTKVVTHHRSPQAHAWAGTTLTRRRARAHTVPNVDGCGPWRLAHLPQRWHITAARTSAGTRLTGSRARRRSRPPGARRARRACWCSGCGASWKVRPAPSPRPRSLVPAPTGMVRAARPLPQPRPAIEHPTEVHLHLHGVPAQDIAAVLAQQIQPGPGREPARPPARLIADRGSPRRPDRGGVGVAGSHGYLT